MTKIPDVPPDLGPSGGRLWRSVVEPYDLNESETALLLSACRTADFIDLLDAQVLAEGVTATVQGQVRAHPALVESRAQKIVLARLVAALRLPEEDAAGSRPRRKSGARGVYPIRGLA